MRYGNTSERRTDFVPRTHFGPNVMSFFTFVLILYVSVIIPAVFISSVKYVFKNI